MDWRVLQLINDQSRLEGGIDLIGGRREITIKAIMLSLFAVALSYKKGWQVKRFVLINSNPKFEIYRWQI